MGNVVKAFWELDVYKLARSLQREIFIISKSFPRDETYSLTDQGRRASRSIGANIAEAWGKRRYQAHFASKLSDAASECNETWHWIDTALECGYLSDNNAAKMKDDTIHIGAMLEKMIADAETWCRG